jgi:hypothetical protein
VGKQKSKAAASKIDLCSSFNSKRWEP